MREVPIFENFFMLKSDEIENLSWSCTDPESFIRGGSTLTTFFFEGRGYADHHFFSFYLMKGERLSGPSWARQRNTIKTAFHWCADDGPTLNAVIFHEIRINIAKKPYTVVI